MVISNIQIKGTCHIIVFQRAQEQTFSLPAAIFCLIASIFLSVCRLLLQLMPRWPAEYKEWIPCL